MFCCCKTYSSLANEFGWMKIVSTGGESWGKLTSPKFFMEGSHIFSWSFTQHVWGFKFCLPAGKDMLDNASFISVVVCHVRPAKKISNHWDNLICTHASVWLLSVIIIKKHILKAIIILFFSPAVLVHICNIYNIVPFFPVLISVNKLIRVF